MKLVARIRRAAARWVAKQLTLSGVDQSRGWTTLLRYFGDTTTGSWQQDSGFSTEQVLGFAPVYACTTLIASDIGKIGLRLMTQQSGVWVETESPSFSPVLRKPNHFQTRQQFIETWIVSKLRRGNTYVLKVRDNRKIVVALYVLDPDRVTPLVAPDGSVFYELHRDDLAKLPQNVYPSVPASEIIHDRMECLFHPLVGIAPLFAATLSATQGLRIQKNSESFFRNMSRPGGMLTAPGTIDGGTAKRLKEEFEANFANEKIGRLFVGGDGLKYDPMAQTALDSQLVDQLKLTAEQVCSAYHVPAYMIGAGPAITATEVGPLIQRYYSQCLQKLFNAIEDLWDEGFGLRSSGYRTEFDLEELIRMDQLRIVEMLTKASGGAYMTPDEARQRVGLLPKPGGDALYKQHQDYSLEALAKRDAKDDPFASSAAAKPDDEESSEAAEAEAKALVERIIKGLSCDISN